MKAVETLLLSDGLCLSLALSGATTVSLQSEGREDEREWRSEEGGEPRQRGGGGLQWRMLVFRQLQTCRN